MVTTVLIPGAGGSSFYWRRVAPLLRARGFDVLTPDLPAGEVSAGIEEYADEVVRAIGDCTDVVLVAQSLGAFTAVAVAERLRVGLLIFVNAMIPADDETAGSWWEAVGQPQAQRVSAEREGRDPDSGFDVMTMFMHDVPPAVIAEVFAQGEPPQSDTPFSTPNKWTRWHAVPSRAIVGTADRLFPLELMRGLVRDRLGVEAHEIDAGHLSALSKPQELAELIKVQIDGEFPRVR